MKAWVDNVGSLRSQNKTKSAERTVTQRTSFQKETVENADLD